MLNGRIYNAGLCKSSVGSKARGEVGATLGDPGLRPGLDPSISSKLVEIIFRALIRGDLSMI